MLNHSILKRACKYVAVVLVLYSFIYPSQLKAQDTIPPQADSFENLFRLGNAYHYNYQLDSAINAYSSCQKLLGAEHSLQNEISRRIEMCNYAKVQLANPINVDIKNMGKSINSQYADFCPLVNADESTLIFTSRREGSTGGNQAIDGRFYKDVYISHNDGSGWSTPENIGPSINTAEHESAIGLSADGQQLFIYKDDEGDGNIYQSSLMGDLWTTPEKLNDNVNSGAGEAHATISSDGFTLYFVSNRKEGLGGTDIYFSNKLPNGDWAIAQNLSAINTVYDEDAPFIHPNGTMLFFSSNGHKSMGGFDIFFTELMEDGTWSEPMNLGYPINTTHDDKYYVPSTDGRRAYYSSVDTSGFGETDIYLAVFKEHEELALTVLKGVMATINEKGEPINAEISVIDIGNLGEEPMIYRPNSNTGKYIIVLPPGKDYRINYVINSTTVHSRVIFVPEESAYQEIEQSIGLQYIDFDGNPADD